MTLGETIFNLRKSKGLSQERLADELNVARQTVSKWELDQSVPDIAYLVKLSDFFGVSVDYLVKGEQVERKKDDEEPSFKEGETKTKASNDNIPKWCFYSGCALVSESLIGVVVFAVLSALHPWTYITGNNVVFKGLFGFLFGTKTFGVFILICIMLVFGIGLCVYGIAKNICARK